MTIPFRFQTLLDYRQRMVEDRQVELAHWQRHYVAVHDLLQQMLANRDCFAEQLRQCISGLLHIGEIEHQYRYLAVLDEQIEVQGQVVARAEEAVESARAQLEEALKQRKTLEKLKEYDEDAFATAARQREAKQVDELNIARYSPMER